MFLSVLLLISIILYLFVDIVSSNLENMRFVVNLQKYLNKYAHVMRPRDCDDRRCC